jgi:hypothetical protein
MWCENLESSGDFSGWDEDAAKYEKAFDKLLKGLQAS